MKKARMKHLEKAGWRVGSAADFLELSPEESALVEMRLALSASLKARRLEQGLSHDALARQLASSQSRIAKIVIIGFDYLLSNLISTLPVKGEACTSLSQINRP